MTQGRKEGSLGEGSRWESLLAGGSICDWQACWQSDMVSIVSKSFDTNKILQNSKSETWSEYNLNTGLTPTLHPPAHALSPTFPSKSRVFLAVFISWPPTLRAKSLSHWTSMELQNFLNIGPQLVFSVFLKFPNSKFLVWSIRKGPQCSLSHLPCAWPCVNF